MSMDERTEFARELLAQHTNGWDGSESLDELLTHKWAIVIERDEDSWVRGIDTHKDIAGYVLSCLTGTEGYDEWVEGVYDLDTGEAIDYSATTGVTVRDGEHEATSADSPDLVPLFCTPAALALIVEALDSHVYWQLSSEDRRDSGYVMEPHTDEEKECMALEERVRKLIPSEQGASA